MPSLDLATATDSDVRRKRTPNGPPPARDLEPPTPTPAPRVVMPPSNGTPALARAGDLVGARDAQPTVTTRAQLSMVLQGSVGNARMGAMAGRSEPSVAPAEPPRKEKNETRAPKKVESTTAPVIEAPKPDAKTAKASGALPVAKTAAAPAPKSIGGEESAAADKAPPAAEAIAPVAKAVHDRAARATKHAPPAGLVASAQAAAITPKTEQIRGASVQTVAMLDSAPAEKVRRDSFKAALRSAIEATMKEPKTEAEAESVMKSGAKSANVALHGSMSAERAAAVRPLASASGVEASPAEQQAPPAAVLQTDSAGAAPAPVAAGPVVPPPLPAERLDYSADRAPADAAMTEAGVTEEQLAKGNEPAFDQTLAARDAAEHHEAGVEKSYRMSEAKVQDGTRKAAQDELAASLGGMHGVRGRHIGAVTGEQSATKAKNAQERQRVTETITGFKTAAKADVDLILSSVEKEAENAFASGLERAEQAYNDAFSDAKGGLGTWLSTWGDKWKAHIERALVTARGAYMREVDVAIDAVANLVDTKLATAKKRIAAARKQTEDYVRGLDESVRGFGEDALQKVSADFDAMSGEVDQRRDALVEKLAQQYKTSYERMTSKESELRAANQPLWDRVKAATFGVIGQILAFKNMLLGILAKAAAVVADIIADPIGFLGNLITGVMTGLQNFTANLGAHLQKGLMEWLFGALGGAGLQMPDTLDLKGIISIVLQVLGLTYANFRARAVAIVGESIVSGLEQTAEIFKTLITEGIPGLWRFIKEKLSDLKSMVMDAIFEFIRDRVITAGITWLIGLLNPASAFFKACKAIYDIVMFFINRGSQIMALVNAVIDSIAAIAKGSVGVAAKYVENALAKAIPVAIGFLASLLGLGDISGTIKKTIDKAQEPVNKAIDWVIHQAVKLVKGVGKALGIGPKSDRKEQAGEGHGPDLDAKVSFSAVGESHHLWISLKGDRAVLMVASDKPMAIAKRLEEWRTRLETLPTETEKGTNPKKRAVESMATVDELLNVTDKTLEKLVVKAHIETAAGTAASTLTNQERQLANALIVLFEVFEESLGSKQWSAEHRAARIERGKGKSWSTTRKGYWRDVYEAKLHANSTAFSPENFKRMENGSAPRMRVLIRFRESEKSLKEKRVGALEERDVSMELHHGSLPQSIETATAHEMWNLVQVMPWSHETIDEWRKTGYDLVTILNGLKTWRGPKPPIRR